MTDQLLLRLAEQVDEAFSDLVDTYGSMVLTLAVRLTDDATGEDIAQEVFLRAYRALRNYDGAQIGRLDLKPWLATITRNLVRNEYRRRERKPTVELGQVQAVEAAADNTIDVIDGRDSVTAMLATLPDDQRDAVVLRHVVGLSMRDVALTLSCPIGTAKSHVSRGISRLRNETVGHQGAEPAGSSEGDAR